MILHYTAGTKGNLSDIGETLSKLRDGEYVIEVVRNRPIKSLSQSRYLFGYVYKEMAIVAGHSAEELHEMMKYKFLSQNIEMKNGVWSTFIGSTKNMDSAQMTLFINQVKQWAEKYLNIKFAELADVDYQRWSEIKSSYDNTFNRI